METFIKEYKINDELCNRLIDYHKNNVEYKQRGQSINENNLYVVDKNVKDSVDVFVFNPSNNKTIKTYFEHLSVFVTDYAETYKIGCRLRTDYVNLIQHYQPNGGYKTWHCERSRFNHETNIRYLTYMTYLNDVEDQGETEFYWQNKKIKAEKGKTIIWPTDFTHLHRGIPSPSQEKYIITGWFILAQ